MTILGKLATADLAIGINMSCCYLFKNTFEILLGIISFLKPAQPGPINLYLALHDLKQFSEVSNVRAGHNEVN